MNSIAAINQGLISPVTTDVWASEDVGLFRALAEDGFRIVERDGLPNDRHQLVLFMTGDAEEPMMYLGYFSLESGWVHQCSASRESVTEPVVAWRDVLPTARDIFMHRVVLITKRKGNPQLYGTGK